jgi:RNA polymerase sigma factor (sigma-70 family)
MDDVDLLHNNPGKLIEKYQDTIIIIVNKFIQTGYVRFADKEDFLQDINEQLLIKIPKIKKQYNEQYRLSTYLSAIIRNICLEKIQKKRTPLLKHLEDEIIIKETIINQGFHNLVIADEITRLENIFLLFSKQKEKLKLCLKFFFRIPISQDDIVQYLEEKPMKELSELNNKETLTDHEIFIILTKIINAKEKKDNSSDAIRKWITARINEILYLMNGNPKRANYDKESLCFLVENYFYKKEENFSLQKV